MLKEEKEILQKVANKLYPRQAVHNTPSLL